MHWTLEFHDWPVVAEAGAMWLKNREVGMRRVRMIRELVGHLFVLLRDMPMERVKNGDILLMQFRMDPSFCCLRVRAAAII